MIGGVIVKKRQNILSDMIFGVTIGIIILGLTILFLAVNGIVPRKEFIKKPIEETITNHTGEKDVTDQEGTDS